MNEDTVVVDEEVAESAGTGKEFDKSQIHTNAMDMIDTLGSETTFEDVEIAIDATLSYVVDWLSSTGYKAKADILAEIGDL